MTDTDDTVDLTERIDRIVRATARDAERDGDGRIASEVLIDRDRQVALSPRMDGEVTDDPAPGATRGEQMPQHAVAILLVDLQAGR